MKYLFLLAFSFLLSCSTTNLNSQKDAHLWLENIEGKKALAWVHEQNNSTVKALAQSPSFKKKEAQVLKILESKERIVYPKIVGPYLYNFWRDKNHVRGLLRRTRLKGYSKNATWESVLDVDQLAKKEKRNWVYKGMNCYRPQDEICMIALSDGGKDAHVQREFNLKKKQFVVGGFFIPEAKNDVSWLDQNHLLLASDFGKGSLSDSGYPRQIRIFKRGSKLTEAPLIFEASKKDIGAESFSTIDKNYRKTHFIKREIDFYSDELFVLIKNPKSSAGFTLLPLKKPVSAQLRQVSGKKLYFHLRKDAKIGELEAKAGTVVESQWNPKNGKLFSSRALWVPKAGQSFKSLSLTKNHLVMVILENVKNKILKFPLKTSSSQGPSPSLLLGNKGEISSSYIVSSSPFKDQLFLQSRSFDRPPSLYLYDLKKDSRKLIQKKSSNFKDKELVVEQKWATSKDKTQVPYFIVHKKGLRKNGKNKTLLYGYGGFEVSLLPYYLSATGKIWLDRGGVYVIANIRGGGEFGPKWHQAALKQNRQRAYDDFIAVAEDLIQKKYTQPQHLGIMGGSNGGLLVGVIMTQRPDLFGAVACLVPLLDMMRYHKLLAGASWMGEYGDPDKAKEKEYLLKYSPYQNLKRKTKYPKLLLYTSTKDDRVHPGHARKMAAKMMKYGYSPYYYENTEGGHAGSSNYKQRAFQKALTFEFLERHL